MSNRLSDFRVSIRQLFLLALVLGIPYGIIGVIWALTHADHLAQLGGVDKVLSFLGESLGQRFQRGHVTEGNSPLWRYSATWGFGAMIGVFGALRSNMSVKLPTQ